MTLLEQIALFLMTIHPTITGWCELRALPSLARLFVRVGDVEAVAAFLARHRHENVYAGVATRRTPTVGTLANCAELWTLFWRRGFQDHTKPPSATALPAFPCPRA